MGQNSMHYWIRITKISSILNKINNIFKIKINNKMQLFNSFKSNWINNQIQHKKAQLLMSQKTWLDSKIVNINFMEKVLFQMSKQWKYLKSCRMNNKTWFKVRGHWPNGKMMKHICFSMVFLLSWLKMIYLLKS